MAGLSRSTLPRVRRVLLPGAGRRAGPQRARGVPAEAPARTSPALEARYALLDVRTRCFLRISGGKRREEAVALAVEVAAEIEVVGVAQVLLDRRDRERSEG